jgi:hypothetical protein
MHAEYRSKDGSQDVQAQENNYGLRCVESDVRTLI